MASASLVLGICSFFIGGLITAIIGLVLGINAKKKAMEYGAPTGVAQAGIVLSIIAMALLVITVIVCISFLSCDGAFDVPYEYW